MAHQLSEQQRAIMRVLWTCDEATVAQVQTEMKQPLAYTTVATVLGRLAKRGLVAHRPEGRTFYYRAAVSEEEVERSVVGDLLNRLFGGSPSGLVSQLLESEYVDAAELERIKELVKRHELKQQGGKGGTNAN